MDEEVFYITESKMHSNTYFIFRELTREIYKEVKVLVIENKIASKSKLTEQEKEWFRKNILNKHQREIYQ